MDLQGIPFTMVYRSILTSSIWTTPHPKLHMVRCVWMTLMLLADKNGFVHASLPGLAAAAVVSIDDAKEAIDLFLAPDPYSRTKEHEGRKIVDFDGGWMLLNYEKHRDAKRDALQKKYRRDWYHKQRASGVGDPGNSSLEQDERSVFVSSDQDQSLAGPDPREATERPVWKSLDGWEPRPELFARAVEIGLPRPELELRLAELRNGPIGGARGVFDRDDYVMRLLPKWKAWHETAQGAAVHAPGSTRGGSGGPRRGGILRSVLDPTGKHRSYAQKHGLDLPALCREMEESGAIEELGHKRALELLGQKMSEIVRQRRQEGP